VAVVSAYRGARSIATISCAIVVALSRAVPRRSRNIGQQHVFVDGRERLARPVNEARRLIGRDGPNHVDRGGIHIATMVTRDSLMCALPRSRWRCTASRSHKGYAA